MAADLSEGMPPEIAGASFDLVTASFFHSHGELPRTRILRAAASRVREGGRLLLISHASPPPWSSHRHQDMTSPQEDWSELDLGADWELQTCTTVRRAATGPGGEQAHLDDGVILARRVRAATDGPGVRGPGQRSASLPPATS